MNLTKLLYDQNPSKSGCEAMETAAVQTERLVSGPPSPGAPRHAMQCLVYGRGLGPQDKTKKKKNPI